MDNSGVKQLCEGLKHPNCKLQKLGLSSVNVNEDTQRELDAVRKRKPDMVIRIWKNWRTGAIAATLLWPGCRPASWDSS
ncbi:hypothetical protein KIL84_015128 [Mauremys mutica]|uniref:Uncharacterized protein n=2 Tax=Mauremys mutica TaxID=74926 RepID=A0A9D3XUL8_9SAUR|nr:hypothetical protein KIL84_015128 [Mauremys mutica]